MTNPKPKLSTRTRLLIAQGQLRALRKITVNVANMAGPAAPPRPKGAPPKFVCGWAEQRGGASFSHFLDEDGGVWVKRVVLEVSPDDGRKRIVTDEWLERLDLRRVVVKKGASA